MLASAMRRVRLIVRGEQIIDQHADTRGLVFYLAHHAVKLTGAELAALLVVVGSAADDAERPAQLAGGVSDDAAHPRAGPAGRRLRQGTRVERMLDLAQHRVDGPDEPAGVAAGVTDRYPA